VKCDGLKIRRCRGNRTAQIFDSVWSVGATGSTTAKVPSWAWPLIQVLISSHRKLLSSKATVVNVAEKSGHDLDRRG
jgi:hypothetical protein